MGCKAPGGQVAAGQTSEPGRVKSGAAKGQYVGFDRNVYPGDERLGELRKSFAFVGYWLNVPPGETVNSWVGRRGALRGAGFGFLVLWNGRLEKAIGKAGVTPAALGKSDAAAAVAAAKKEGFPAGAVVFLDQEEGGRLTEAQAGYFFAWTEGVAAGGYKPGAYLSGEESGDGVGPDGKPLYITTAADVQAHVKAGGLHEVKLWVYQNACPPSPGCSLGAPRVQDSGVVGIPDAMVWQYAQSPRRVEHTQSCVATYGADGLCYGGATKDLFVDLDVAAVSDPSGGR